MQYINLYKSKYSLKTINMLYAFFFIKNKRELKGGTVEVD